MALIVKSLQKNGKRCKSYIKIIVNFVVFSNFYKKEFKSWRNNIIDRTGFINDLLHICTASLKKIARLENRFSLVLLDVFVDTSKPCFHTSQSLKTITAIKDPNNKNKLVKDSSHIPNIVNEHFASVRSRLANKFPSSQQHYLDFVNKNMFPMPSFFFQPLTLDCIKTEILSLPNNKSHGLYSSPTKLLKCSIDIIAPVLSEVFSISISLNWNCPKLCLFLNPMMRRAQIIIDLYLYYQTSTK